MQVLSQSVAFRLKSPVAFFTETKDIMLTVQEDHEHSSKEILFRRMPCMKIKTNIRDDVIFTNNCTYRTVLQTTFVKYHTHIQTDSTTG
jgi:hypothetical protein